MRLLRRFLNDIEKVYWCKKCGERLKSLEKAKVHVKNRCSDSDQESLNFI